ncbi:hypothetical protein ERO13_A03G139100v2 [Gossypium hirsutum]|uniref:Histone H3.v1 n=1 Tax=Gossypium hirsutum TaxID=3635 RepID=A0ABM3ALD0_GOSHI|nr:histone H3.v1-like [Gossypium hirsutum]KAG4208534.1 hypothetical protein ERO13_A03G139100v2 [Gossypium hirsutum]
MQVMTSSLPLSPNFNEFSPTGKFSHDFRVKLQLKADEEPNMEQEEKLNHQPGKDGDNEDEQEVEEQNEEEEDEEEEEEEEEFSFVCLNPDGSPISADDLFQDGQIRPIFPLFNQDLLYAAADDAFVSKSGEGDMAQRTPVRKLFVEDSPDATSSEPAGPYCEWRGGRTVTEASPESCRKSNSTGFSKLWRFRDLKLRCSSDGKDAFVFLSHHSSSSSSSSSSSVKTEKKNEKEEKKDKVKVSEETPKVKKTQKSIKTASLSAHEKLYVKNRAQKEGDKRRSYLPYRQVGFFTNVNGLSRNVHPF